MAFREKAARKFKANINAEDGRRRRNDQMVELRKNNREDQLLKRRVTTAPVNELKIDSTGAPLLEPTVTMIPALVEVINSNDGSRHLECVTQLRKLLSIERNPPIQEVINSGVVPRLINLLQDQSNAKLQFECAWALTNVASGNASQTKVVIDFGGVDVFVSLLRSHSVEVIEQAVWALGNIAGDCAATRDIVLRAGALGPLCGIVDSREASLSLKRNATWAISNCCRGKPQPAWEHVRPALPYIAKLLQEKDEEILTDAMWALSYISDDNSEYNHKIQAVLDTGITPRLVELLRPSASIKVTTPALRTVGNIVTGTDAQTQTIMNYPVLNNLLALLVSQKKAVRKEACWTLSNITAGNKEQIQSVIQANLVVPLIGILSNDVFDVQKEACWALSNITSGGSRDQVRYLIQQNLISPMVSLLSSSETKILLVSLEALENMLVVGDKDAKASGTANNVADLIEEAGGLDHIENLQRHENEQIYQKAVALLRGYFEGDDDEEEATSALAPTGNTFTFGAPVEQMAPSQPFSFGGFGTAGGAAGGNSTPLFNFGS